jgi:carbamoyl-phosphate synthase large subunit
MNLSLADIETSIAVSGLKTGDNPQPGVPVIRSLRNAGFKGKIIGLVYDSLEAGIYVRGLADEVYQMPYPSGGSESFLKRLDYILSRGPIGVVIPTLDVEVLTYIRLRKELASRGIQTYLPDEEHFLLRDKSKLPSTFPGNGVAVPQTIILNEASSIFNLPQLIEFPVYVKGRYYEAYRAFTVEEVRKYYHLIADRWGLPILVQCTVPGDEFNVVLVGDGAGGIIGMVPQRKVVITDKGKGFGGVVVENQGLDDFARKVICHLKWRGPCELEIIRGQDGIFYLIEINPRFPAWVRLAEAAGQNLPAAVVLLALGRKVEPFSRYKSGTMFVRHAEDVISDIGVMGEISTHGEIVFRSPGLEDPISVQRLGGDS